MYVYQILHRRAGCILLLCLLLTLIEGCSLPFISRSAASPTHANCRPAALQTVNGTIHTLSGATLLITDTHGKTVRVTYTSATRFTRDKLVTRAALQEGTPVLVAVSQNADQTYTATRIAIGNVVQNNLGSGSKPRPGLNATPGCSSSLQIVGAPSGGPAQGNGSAHTIEGTIGQLNGNVLTVTDLSGANYTVTLTSATQVVQTDQVSASALQAGVQVAIAATSNTQGVLMAQFVMILLPQSGNPAHSIYS